jgi:competence protein ComEA
MKKILFAFIAFVLSIGTAFAAININTATEAELDAIKGVGPAKAKAIVEERSKNGAFKSLDDVGARVKGIGDKTVAGWKKDGSVSVSGANTVPAKADAKKEDKPKADAGKKDTPKSEDKKDAAPKSDAKKDAPKADAKKEEKKDAPKADAKKEEKKAEAKKDAPKADAKKEDKKDAKKDSPKADEGKKDAKKEEKK